MEETSDWRRAIGCSSVQIGRSCELRRLSPVKGSIDVSLAKGWGRRFESPHPLQIPRINGKQRPWGSAVAYTGLYLQNCKLSVSSRQISVGYHSALSRRADSSVPRFGSRWTHIAPRWWTAKVERPDTASGLEGAYIPNSWRSSCRQRAQPHRAVLPPAEPCSNKSIPRPPVREAGAGDTLGPCGGTRSPVMPKYSPGRLGSTAQ
jgi:hypothetical protein